MSNKRIDLTQFEGMSDDWEVVPQPDGEYVIVTGRDNSSLEEAYTIAKLPNLIAELERCYEREDMIIRALKDAWIGNTCWHQPSENLEDIAETRGSILGAIASLLSVDVNRQDIHDFDNGCGGENCDHNASE